MQTLIKKINGYSPNSIKLTLVLISLAIATQVQYIQHGLISTDSVFYLEAAKLFSQAEWKAGFDIYPWPFYSLWISAVHYVTTLSIYHSAVLLNIVFFGVTSANYLTIIQLAGGKQLQLVTGGIILISSQYLIGGVLEMLLRDEGFWAFYLTSIVFLIQYHQRHRLQDALLWQLCIICAVLFRIEAFLYLLLLPLVILLNPQINISNRLILLFKAYSLQIIIALSLVLLMQANENISSSMLGRLNEIFTPQLLSNLTRLFKVKSELMSNLVLGPHLDEFSKIGLSLTFIFVIIFKITKATGIITIVLAFFSFKNRNNLIENKSTQIIVAAAVISIAIMALIITKVFVLSTRYAVGLSFILMIFASFYLADILNKTNNTINKRLSFWLLAALMIVMTLGTIKNLLPKRDGYNFRQQATTWLSKYNSLKEPVYYDDKRLRYYAGEKFIGGWVTNTQHLSNEIKKQNFNQYGYLMISSNVKSPEYEHLALEKLPQFTEIKRFFSYTKDKSIVIYEKNNTQ